MMIRSMVYDGTEYEIHSTSMRENVPSNPAELNPLGKSSSASVRHRYSSAASRATVRGSSVSTDAPACRKKQGFGSVRNK